MLDITAESGAGNLLGNLLCAVVNLLNDPTRIGTIAQPDPGAALNLAAERPHLAPVGAFSV